MEISPEMKLLALRAYIFVKTLVNTFMYVSTTVGTALIVAFQPKEYVFFKGYTTPLLLNNVSLTGPGIPEVTWTYYEGSNTLVKGLSNESMNLPWLSASVRYNGITLYSLDDFVSNMKFSGETVPPPAVIVGAWSVKSGVYLDRALPLELLVINEDGDEVAFPIDSFEEGELVEEEAPSPVVPQPPTEIPSLQTTAVATT
jgi:hypothetical protein